MKQSYYITHEHQIHSDENGDFTPNTLSLALAVVGGWSVHEKTALDDMIVSRTLPGGEVETRFIPSILDPVTVEKHAQTYGIQPLAPLQSVEFAQSLMSAFPCVITPIISHGGALRGMWRVESLSGWNAADIRRAGVRYGHNEYVETLSTSLAEAIGLNALSRVGIGKQAYFYYPDMSVENAELVYMGQATIDVVSMDPEFMLHLVPAPELDAYAMVNAPEDVLQAQRDLADAQAVIKKAELKKLVDERKAKEEAEAPAKQDAPEAETDAAAEDVEPVNGE